MGTVGCCVFVLPKSSLHRHRKEQASGITAGTVYTGLSPKKASWDKFGSYSGQLVFNY